MLQKVIAVDFDGVLCDSVFPEANHQNLVNKFFLWYVKRKQKHGWLVTLWTCREDNGLKKYALSRQKAIAFLQSLSFYPDFINENDPSRIEKYGIDSKKVSADIYIDDRNIGLLGWFLRSVHNRSQKRFLRKIVDESIRQTDIYLGYKVYNACIKRLYDRYN